MSFLKLTLRLILVMFLCTVSQAEGLSPTMVITDDSLVASQNDSEPTRAFSQHPSQVPQHFEVRQNYPNPFNAKTIIEFDLPIESGVFATIYNILGRRIRILENYTRSPGSYQVEWDGMTDFGQPVTSGVYFFVLLTDDNYAIRKMLLLK